MLKKTITYKDFDGLERTEDFYFNLTQSEIIEMDFESGGGLVEMMEKVVAAKNTREIMRIFKRLLFKAYGEKTEDGRHVLKSPEISRKFSQSAAYDKFFMELVTDAEAAAIFVNSITPPRVD